VRAVEAGEAAMIGSIAIVQRRVAEAWPHPGRAALIAIATPGCAIAAPIRLRTLHVVFHTLQAELEAASLRLPDAPPARPFDAAHAHAIVDFIARLQRECEPVALLVCESEGLARSATVARWAARHLGRPLHEGVATPVPGCALIGDVLRRAVPATDHWRNSRREPTRALRTMRA
jgi:hypothetical protein